jgi:anti-sigma factor RsiW
MNLNGPPSPTRIGELDLHAFVDGVLGDDRRNELLAYLASHPLEAERVNGYFRQQAALAALRDQLRDGRDAAFRPDLQRGLARALRRQRLLRRLGPIAAALAVIAPASLAGWIFERQHALSEADARLAVAAAAEASDVTFAFGDGPALVEVDAVGADGAAPIAILAQHLADQSLRVPDLGRLGLHLMGGDALEGTATPAARLVYEDDLGHRLLVYVGMVSSSVEQAMALVPEGHIALHLRRGPLLFAVIGRADSPRLLDVVRLVSEEMTEVAAAPLPEAIVESHEISPIKPILLPSGGDGGGSEPIAPVTPDAGRGGAAPIPVVPGPTAEEQPKIL